MQNQQHKEIAAERAFRRKSGSLERGQGCNSTDSKDAKVGIYGKDSKALELRAEQMKKYISPDRDSAIAQVSKLLSFGSLQKAGTNTFRLSGLPYTAAVTKGRNGITADIYDEYGSLPAMTAK